MAKPLIKSRIMLGSTIAVLAPILAEIATALAPLASFNETLKLATTLIGVAGALLAIYARFDDRLQGRN